MAISLETGCVLIDTKVVTAFWPLDPCSLRAGIDSGSLAVTGVCPPDWKVGYHINKAPGNAHQV